MRRTYLLAAVAAALLAATSPARAAVMPAQPADQFQDSIGVNVHTMRLSTQGAYGSGAKIKQALDYLGVKHVRDCIISPGNTSQPHWHWTKLQSLGVGVLACISQHSYPDSQPSEAFTPTLISRVRAAIPNVEAWEGPNEPDIFGPSIATSNQIQQWVYNAVAGREPVVCWAAVYSQNDTAGRCDGQSDYGNAHPYPGNRQETASHCASEMGRAMKIAPQSTQQWATEWGYAETAIPPGGWEVVTEAQRAWRTINGLFELTSCGFDRTYLYELFSADSMRWGLFNEDVTPRRAASLLRAWQTVMADPGVSPSGGSLDVTMTHPDFNTRLYRKSDGRYWLALWPKVEGSEATWPPRYVTVTLGGAARRIILRHPEIQTTGYRDFGTTNQVSVPMRGRYPAVLEIV
jgi:hypothetical protein